ncbi:MAG: AAA family ATPase, partial [Candidatus Binatia bacterium]
PGVLRVLVTASPGRRAARLGEDDARLTARRAATAITNSDRERREYLREFYNVREELPTHYDLVINTDVLSPEQTVTLIVGVARDWPRS